MDRRETLLELARASGQRHYWGALAAAKEALQELGLVREDGAG